MFSRRNFLAIISSSVLFTSTLSLPQMALADISGLILSMNNFCDGVEQMQDMLIDNSSTGAEMRDALLFTTVNYSASASALPVDNSALSEAERATLGATTERYRDCRATYFEIKGRFILKLNQALASAGQSMDTQLIRQLNRENDFGSPSDIDNLLNRILGSR